MSPRLRRAATALAAAAALGLACAGPAPPSYRYFELALPQQEVPVAPHRLPGVLVVERPRAHALLLERALLWRRDDASPELLQHPRARWVDLPITLVEHAAVRRLEAAGVADAVMAAGLGVRGDWRMTSELHRLERIAGPRPAVEIELEVGVMRSLDRSLVGHGRHAVRLPLSPGDGMEEAVNALGRGLGEILDEVVAELASAAAARPVATP